MILGLAIFSFAFNQAVPCLLFHIVICPEAARKEIPHHDDKDSNDHGDVVSQNARRHEEIFGKDLLRKINDRLINGEKEQIADPKTNAVDQEKLAELLRDRFFPGVRIGPVAVLEKIGDNCGNE